MTTEEIKTYAEKMNAVAKNDAVELDVAFKTSIVVAVIHACGTPTPALDTRHLNRPNVK